MIAIECERFNFVGVDGPLRSVFWGHAVNRLSRTVTLAVDSPEAARIGDVEASQATAIINFILFPQQERANSASSMSISGDSQKP